MCSFLTSKEMLGILPKISPANKETIENKIYVNASFTPKKPATTPISMPIPIGSKIKKLLTKLLNNDEMASTILSYIFVTTAIVPPETPGMMQARPIPIPFSKSNIQFLNLFITLKLYIPNIFIGIIKYNLYL